MTMLNNRSDREESALNTFFNKVRRLEDEFGILSDEPIPGLFFNPDDTISGNWSGILFSEIGAAGLILPIEMVIIYAGMFVPERR